MRILVLVKQVSEPESAFTLEQGQVHLRQPARYKMSLYDEFALEAGLRLKESVPGASLCAASVGPERALAVLQRAGGMGADRVVRLDPGPIESPRPSLTAAWLAAWAEDQGFDLILAGVASEDAMNGAVGPMLARLLNLPAATSVVEIQAGQDSGSLIARREMEGGQSQTLQLPLPALITVQSNPAKPRYPTLSGLLRAKQTQPEVVACSELTPVVQRESLVQFLPPLKRRQGLVLEGDCNQKAAHLLEILRQRALL